jgi:hypothetical protein
MVYFGYHAERVKTLSAQTVAHYYDKFDCVRSDHRKRTTQ